ncbi:vacuolar sorting protein [Scheffersomyces coipomensis]|uniref:vacuolar sorting protein n=1 Tax=Scheffersomyces coipomensis TaxID=1788519 RepID=UPI00315D9B36
MAVSHEITTPNGKVGDGNGSSLFDLPTKSIKSPSSSSFENSSVSSIQLSTPIKRLRFDDRSQTKTSVALRHHNHNSNHPQSPNHNQSYNSLDSSSVLQNQSNIHLDESLETSITSNSWSSNFITKDIFKWKETLTISSIINAPDFININGSVVCIEPSSIYIALGTNKGCIIIFNYHQGVEFILSFKDENQSSNQNTAATTVDPIVSTMAFSADSTFIAAGYTNGQIKLWDLSSKSSESLPGSIEPYFTINPITLQERFTQISEGHLKNTPITHISFIGDKYYQLISSDLSGLVFYHNGIKKFLQKYFISQKLLGNNDANISDNSTLINDCQVLPLGDSNQLTDQLGLMAVITNNILTIVSILSLNNPHNVNLIQHFKIGKSKYVNNLDNVIGSLDWFPCMKAGEEDGDENNNTILNAKLAYAWNNVLTILELDNQSISGNMINVLKELKDKDKGLPKFHIYKTVRWLTPDSNDSIVSVKWLSSSILNVFVKNHDLETITMTSLYYSPNKELIIAGQDSIANLSITNNLLFGTTHERGTTRITKTAFESYNYSIKVVKHRILAISDDKKVFIGRSSNWADTLYELLSQKQYFQALSTANDYYLSTNSGKLVLVGLPADPNERAKIMTVYLLKIMQESIPHIFTNHDSYGQLNTCLNILSYLSTSGSKEESSSSLSQDLMDLMESIYENFQKDGLFFETLKSFILLGSITTIPPIVLQKLVEYFVENDQGELLTEMLCLLDIQLLDIDLTIQLCEKYNLRECLIYIWNFLLNDYSTPLIDFVNDFNKNPQFIRSDDYLQAYTYMSYILTGRQYPTDRFIDFNKELAAKESITNVLFSMTPIVINGKSIQTKNDKTIFPYLYCFLRANSFEMLTTLNEFFEDRYLNDDENRKLNRQYITEALLDVYEINQLQFTDFDRCQLAIFIGRNYPKYSQFIRLSESTLNRIINDLCNNTDQELVIDCELALQSLLPHYEPEDDDYLLEKLHIAKYYNVLLNIYKSQGKYSKVLEIWLEKLSDRNELLNDIDNNETDNESINNILENSFMLSKSITDKLSLVRVIRNNFETFASLDLHSFINLLSRYNPQLHEEILLVCENDIFVFKYLEVLFQTSNIMEISHNISNFNKLIIKYLELLYTFKRSTQIFDFLEEWKYELFKNKSEFYTIFELVKEKDLIECVASLMLLEDKYRESLDELLRFMKTMVAKIANEDVNGQQKELTRFRIILNHGISICQKPQTFDIEYDNELKLNEKMWLELIENLVELANLSMANQLVHEFLNKCIHDVFRTISDTKLKQQERSFLVIFNKFLANSSDKSTLSNIRGILQEVFISYSYESEMLKISLSMLNENIYKSMKLIKLENLKGWVIKSKICSSCSKVMWGNSLNNDILSEHYNAWEDKQRSILMLSSSTNDDNQYFKAPYDKEKYHNCELIFFKCNHGYHSKCLDNLGGKDIKTCVICYTD